MVEPRFRDYQDNGCAEAPLCVECRHEFCKYDDPELFLRVKKSSRDIRIALALKSGSSTAEIAREFGLSERTVYRVRAEMV